GIELASTPVRLWVGCPTTVDPSGRVQFGPFAPNPTTAGNFLRTQAGTWVAGLPLSGGIVTGGLTISDGAIPIAVAGLGQLSAVGGLTVGGPAGPIPGPGIVNITGQYQINGVPLANIPEPTTAGN